MNASLRLILTATLAMAVLAVNSRGFAEEPAKKPAKAAADEKGKEEARFPEITEEIKTLHLLQTAWTLAEYGRKEKSPEALLIAAGIMGRAPKGESMGSFGKDDPKEKKEAADPAKEAAALIDEAAKLAAELPEERQASVKALAKATQSQIGEQERSPVVGFKRYDTTFGPNETRSETIDLVGFQTAFAVTSYGGNFQVNIRGALTGLNYGNYSAVPGGPINTVVSHLSPAKLIFTVTNTSNFASGCTIIIQ
jgi:hypothetical protein